jgi:hypothetical protein
MEVRLYRERLNQANELQKATEADLELTRTKLAEKEKLYEGAVQKLRDKNR